MIIDGSVSIAATLAPSTHVGFVTGGVKLGASVTDESQSVVSESASELEKIIGLKGAANYIPEKKSGVKVQAPTSQSSSSLKNFVKPSPPASPAPPNTSSSSRMRTPSPSGRNDSSDKQRNTTPTPR